MGVGSREGVIKSMIAYPCYCGVCFQEMSVRKACAPSLTTDSGMLLMF